MDDKKEWIHVKRDSWIIIMSLVLKCRDFCTDAFADHFHVDEDDDIEEEGDEDKADAAKDPGGESGQTNRVGGRRPKSRDEKVYQHLC